MKPLAITCVVEGPPIPWQRAGVIGRRRYTPADSAAYRRHAAWTILAALRATPGWERAGDKGMRWGVSLYVVFGDKRARDLDNVAKQFLDLCNGLIWRDDSQVDDLSVKRGKPGVRPFVTFSAWEIWA